MLRSVALLPCAAAHSTLGRHSGGGLREDRRTALPLLCANCCSVQLPAPPRQKESLCIMTSVETCPHSHFDHESIAKE
ncbi:hypothetical protein CB1_001354005 [Camelus ferus]|nr:hypothetical protein CB1_001354005 [Camelus ferus]